MSWLRPGASDPSPPPRPGPLGVLSRLPPMGPAPRDPGINAADSDAEDSVSEDDGFAADADEELQEYQEYCKIAQMGKKASTSAPKVRKKRQTIEEMAAQRKKLLDLLDPTRETMTDAWGEDVARRSHEAAKKVSKRTTQDENRIDNARGRPHGIVAPDNFSRAKDGAGFGTGAPLGIADTQSIVADPSAYVSHGDPSSPSADVKPSLLPPPRSLPPHNSAAVKDPATSDSEEEMLPSRPVKKEVKPQPIPATSNGHSVESRPVDSDSEEEMIKPMMKRQLPPPKADPLIVEDSEEELLTQYCPPSGPARPSTLNVKPFSHSAASFTPTSAIQIVNPRPPFVPQSAEQELIGPLILDANVAVPASINRFLRDYQRRGIEFLYCAYKEGRGAILADDMGLGKTVQVAAFLAAIMGKEGGSRDTRRRAEAIQTGRLDRRGKADSIWPTCLILVPKSLTGNWISELNTWGYFEHERFGSGSEHQDTLYRFQQGYFDIVLCSHEYATRHILELKDLPWSCVFADEAHKFKNPATQMTKAMNLFECKRRFAMTGTVIQNRSEEMWTLLDWTSPGTFADLNTWQLLISIPLRLGQRSTASRRELDTTRTVAHALTKKLLPPYMLRRTKALVAKDLPTKHEKIVFCPLSPTQFDAYRRLLALPEVEAMREADKPCPCGAKDDEGLPFKLKNCCDQTADTEQFFRTLYLLLCLANHAALFFPTPADANSPKLEIRARHAQQKVYCHLLWPEDWRRKECNDRTGLDERLCGKWLALRELLKEWKAIGDKVLIFSRSLRLLGWIESWISRSDYKWLRLDGSTHPSMRQGLVEQFNKDPSIFCFLISTSAGGVGLNLTGANKVVVVDPNWSPAMDAQAVDRAYRIGQTRPVTVFRLIGAGTIEELVYGRQVYKTQAAYQAYGGKDGEGMEGSNSRGGKNVATGGRRYFEGVEMNKKYTGELFGIGNLLSYQEESISRKLVAVEDADPDAAGDGDELEELARGLGNVRVKTEGGASERGATAADVRRALRAGSGEEDETDDEEDKKSRVKKERKPRTSGASSGGRRRRAVSSEEDESDSAVLRRVGISAMHDHQQLFDSSDEDEGEEGDGSFGPRKQKKRKTTKGKREPQPHQPQQPAAIWPPPRARSAQGNATASI